MWHSSISRVTKILLFHKTNTQKQRYYVCAGFILLFFPKHKLYNLLSCFQRKHLPEPKAHILGLQYKSWFCLLAPYPDYGSFVGFLGLQTCCSWLDSLGKELEVWLAFLNLYICVYFMMSNSCEINKILFRNSKPRYVGCTLSYVWILKCGSYNIFLRVVDLSIMYTDFQNDTMKQNNAVRVFR